MKLVVIVVVTIVIAAATVNAKAECKDDAKKSPKYCPDGKFYGRCTDPDPDFPTFNNDCPLTCGVCPGVGSEWFYITSADPAAKGKVVDIPQGYKGYQLVLWDKNGKDHQLWKWDGGFLVSKANGLVMDIARGNKNANARVVAWDSRHKGLNQQWELRDGRYIASKLNNMVLKATGTWNDARIQMSPNTEDVSMKWNLVVESASDYSE